MDGWPHVMGSQPSNVAEAPFIDQRWRLTDSQLDPSRFEGNIDGKPTHLYRLSNDKGMEVCITNFGARVVSIVVPDRNGIRRDVVLGYDDIAPVSYTHLYHYKETRGCSSPLRAFTAMTTLPWCIES